MDNGNNQLKKVSFCRKCGSRLIDDSMHCSKCGTKTILFESFSDQIITNPNSLDQNVIETKAIHYTDNSTQNVHTANAEQPLKRKHKYILLSCLGIVILAAVLLAVTHFVPERIVTHNLDSINGCPEFFDVEFGMTAAQASEQIDVAHETVTGYENSLGSQDSFIYLSEGSEYNLYGLSTKDVYCGFNGLKLNSVIIVFSKAEVGMERIISLYTKIYGQPTNAGSWIGKITTVEVIDAEEVGNSEQEIIVRYSTTPNSQYSMLSFDGSEIDPCGFLGDNYIFDKQVDYYIRDLTKGDDYDLKEYSAAGFADFSQYTLYPKFEYMGISNGFTAIEFNVDADNKNISLISYKFLLDTSNSSNRVEYIGNRLLDAYGDYEECTYTSMLYSEIGIEDISFEELCKRIDENTQGIYHIQWISNGRRITLGFTIDSEKTYYEGFVSFSS